MGKHTIYFVEDGNSFHFYEDCRQLQNSNGYESVEVEKGNEREAFREYRSECTPCSQRRADEIIEDDS